MGELSKIEWCRHTFNPWWGCVRVSPGCQRCYAEAFAKRTGHPVWGVSSPRRFFGDEHWSEPLKWNRAAEQSGERHRVFCASMADVFEQLPAAHPQRVEMSEARLRLWVLIEQTPHLEWLLLTKRPESVSAVLLDAKLPNIRIGVTAEDQLRHDERWPKLAELRVPNFLSCEPLLEGIELRCHGCGNNVSAHLAPDGGGCSGWFPDHVIVGGESGGKSRPFDLTWARNLQDQCNAARIPFFFKQAGSSVMLEGEPLRLRHRKGADLNEVPAALQVRDLPMEAP